MEDVADEAMNGVVLTLRFTHEEAGAVYAVMESIISLGILTPKGAVLQSVVDKLKAAQTVAIKELVVAESARGEAN